MINPGKCMYLSKHAYTGGQKCMHILRQKK